jgi:serine/threonine protein kinase/tetratricopeptide (TPR) repeat protein
VTEPADKTPRGRLRALLDWFTSDATPARPLSETTPAPRATDVMPSRIAHYAITGKLGQGGMGVVYAARDERLDRVVAVKTIAALGSDETARKRFWREARAAASVNHPNVCQLYEVGEHAGEPYIVMELLSGQPLSERLQGGALTVAEAVPVGLGILAALGALHERGIVHRDLKPSNVFLTPHGVKLLDFGLARNDAELENSLGSVTALTRSGIVLGTPRYMAPEQITGEEVGTRSDLFALGAILFEMLAGRPAFVGRNVVEILHATLHEQPPALTGSPAVAAADRVIRRALAKKPTERYATAVEMGQALRALSGNDGGEHTPALARALTRIVVVPFRVLRADPETDFLAFSLPDAISTTLSGLGSLVVRSSAAAARYAGEVSDLKALATDLDVDRVVLGTLLRAGDQIRATAQLVEAPGGTLLRSYTVQASLGDLFQLQDDITHRVVDALALPLGGGSPSPVPDAPHDPRAYELYLRGNELARSYDQLPQARELYERCLELDPRFAPAWARLARCHRVIGKYIERDPQGASRAEQALHRALELNPRLTIAHKVFANLEADTGHARQAVVRLLREVARHGNDAELFAGLVHACRYCGLYEESMAAHREARRLDPHVPTSLEQTVLMTGDLDRLLGVERDVVGGGDQVIRVIGLGLAGRRDDAKVLLVALREASRIEAFKAWADYIMAWLDRRVPDMLAANPLLQGFGVMDDPEAIFQDAWLLCDVGEHDRGLDALRRAVEGGYSVVPTLRGSRQFDALRGDPRFQKVVDRAEEGRAQARAAFREAGGERLLGL